MYHGQVSGFVDIDHLPVGPRVYDIGYLLADFAKARFVRDDPDSRWLEYGHLIVAGYEQVCTLQEREKAAIATVMLATESDTPDHHISTIASVLPPAYSRMRRLCPAAISSGR